MKEINRGDVYFCRGSSSAIGSEERKERPVVIVQNDVGNAKSQTTIAVPLTSNTDRRAYPMQFYVQIPGHTCRGCCNLVKAQSGRRETWKCKAYGMLSSKAGDWSQKFEACGLFEKTIDGHAVKLSGGER